MPDAATVFKDWEFCRSVWEDTLRYHALGGTSWFAGPGNYSHPVTPEHAESLIRDRAVRWLHDEGYHIAQVLKQFQVRDSVGIKQLNGMCFTDYTAAVVAAVKAARGE